MAERLAPNDYDQLNHFIADSVWDAAPLERELLIQVDRLVGDSDAVMVITPRCPREERELPDTGFSDATAINNLVSTPAIIFAVMMR